MTGRGPVLWGLALVILVAAGASAARAAWIDPPALAAACAHHAGPLTICALRAGINALARYGIFGAVALVCGIAAITAPNLAFILAALCAGMLGLINYNVSWGMLGACLGGWAWLRQGKESLLFLQKK